MKMKISGEKMSQAIKNLFQEKNKFVDDSFPPTVKSLYRDPNSHLAGCIVQWLRCDEIRSHKSEDRVLWSVYRTPMPDDISQGQLGNCWYVLWNCVISKNIQLVCQQNFFSSTFFKFGDKFIW